MALTGKTNAEKIWNFLRSKGLNAYGAAGLMGNLYAESGLNPQNLQNTYERELGLTDAEYTAAVDSGIYTNFVRDSAGYGLAQWTYWSRKKKLLDYVKAAGASIGDLEAQLCFLWKDLSEGYTSVFSVLKNASSVKEASDVVLTKYERPANQSDSVKTKRAGYGQKYFDMYAAGSPAITKKGDDNMGVRMGHASISENGTISGNKGDSTGKEVCVRSWYSKPWDYMAIHPDPAVREKHARAVEAACANNNIGYSQNSRNTLNTLAKSVGYDLSKVGKCNCDCSSLQHVAAIASGVDIPYGSNAFRTGNMKAALKAAGYIIITDKTPLKSSAYCVRGAIYVKANGHTTCGLDNGSMAAKTLENVGIAAGTSAPTANPAKGKLSVDGMWGSATTRRLQEIFGIKADGIVSNQVKAYKAKNPGLMGGWEWLDRSNGKGSELIKALQKWAGMTAYNQDGEIGPNTIKALQRKLGVTEDGRVSKPSNMVKALQMWANEQ